MNPVNKLLLLLGITAVLFTACDDNRVYEENQPFTDESWGVDEVAVFRVDMHDTNSRHRFFFNVRNGGQYPYSNLYFFITTQFPDSSMAVDTVEIMLADAAGKWLGEGAGNVYENRVLFNENVVFPDTGQYIFTIRHGMRMEELPHVLDAGLRIERQ